MLHVENKHWNDVQHTIEVPSWEAYLVLNVFGGKSLTDRQRQSMETFSISSADTGVRSFGVESDPYIPYVHVDAVIEAEDEEAALSNSIVASLGALANAGIELPKVEFVDAYLVSEEKLAHEKAIDPLTTVDEARYHVDERYASDIFRDELLIYADLMLFARAS